MKQLTEQEMISNKRERGCPYRMWDWHDGGPDMKCCVKGIGNYSCRNSHDNYYHEAENCPKYLGKQYPNIVELINTICTQKNEPPPVFTKYQRQCLKVFVDEIMQRYPHIDQAMLEDLLDDLEELWVPK